MIPRLSRLSIVALVGDVCLLLLFAAIGRTSHNDSGALAIGGVAGTAAPFIIGWVVAAIPLGALSPQAFTRPRDALRNVALAWPVACAIGIGIRSLFEGRFTHPAFILVALLFNFATIGTWHGAYAWWHERRGRLAVAT